MTEELTIEMLAELDSSMFWAYSSLRPREVSPTEPEATDAEYPAITNLHRSTGMSAIRPRGRCRPGERSLGELNEMAVLRGAAAEPALTRMATSKFNFHKSKSISHLHA